MYYVYLLECKDKTFYTGSTNDINKRLAVHNAGNGAKYTRGRLPVKLKYSESFETKSQALKREIEIKKLNKKEKINLM